MKIRANAVGREYVRIFKNDNGYIQDFSIEVVSKSNLTDLRNELQQKKNELQPLFVGEVDLAGINVLYKNLKLYESYNFFEDYHKFNGSGQVIHQIINVPGIAVGFFNKAHNLLNLQNLLLRELQKARSKISNFRFSNDKKGILIDKNALEFKILKEGTSYIYNSHKDYHYQTSYRTKYTHSVKKKRWPKKTIWESYYRVDVEWYIAYARDKLVNVANLFWKHEEFKAYLEKMRVFIELERTIAELEKESAEIQGGINNLL